jgi:hypothetical protein
LQSSRCGALQKQQQNRHRGISATSLQLLQLQTVIVCN